MSGTKRALLRQGRGAGFLAALGAGRGASEDVLDCVLDDPRWDRQVEVREDYYAQLLIASGASVEPLRARIVNRVDVADESDGWLAIGVLAEMCRRRCEAARRAMAEAIEAGPWWRACLDALEAAGGADLLRQAVTAAEVHALVARADENDLADAVNTVAAPWEAWALEVPALERVVREAARDPHESRPMVGPVAWAARRIRAPRPAREGRVSIVV